MAAITRYLSNDIHTFQIVFFRSLFGGVFLLPWLLRTGIRGLHTERIEMHALSGMLGLITIYLLFTALKLALLGEVATILATRPIIVSLLAIVVLREAALGRRWTALLLGFAGAGLILRPGISEMSTGVLQALVSVVLMAALVIVMKSLSRTEASDTVVTYQMAVFIPLTLVPALFVWSMPDLKQLTLLIGIGLAETLTQSALTRAYAAADATVVMPFDFTRLIFSALLGLIVFAEFPDMWAWAGAAVILVAVIHMAQFEAKVEQERRQKA